MTQSWRLPEGGVIERLRPLAFTYDDKRYEGYAGATLASALLANGVHLVARSFKYHRPRGICTAGVEEPNALVQLARGARTEPNTRATTQELYDGMAASSQNCWPSVRFDVGAIADAMSPMLPAGFYYKTFMWPRTPKWWLRYEHAIRRGAGMGRAPDVPDPDHYEHQYAHCDVLASGAIERGIAYANNDLPGTLLAGAALTYVKRYAVRLGTRAVVFANNDGAYRAALALHEAGVAISAIVDVRRESQLGGALPARARAAGLALLPASVVSCARGSLRVSGVDVVPRAGGAAKSFDCDVIAVSGGYSPAVHLFSQARGSLKYDAITASFFPDASPLAITPAGAVNGHFSLAEAIADGEAAAVAALARTGLHIARSRPASPPRRANPMAVEAFWAVASLHQ